MSRLVVSVNILLYNGKKYIKGCLESVFNQSFRSIEVNILDNNSYREDWDEAERVIKDLCSKDIKCNLIKSKENLGFAKGHNFLIERSCGEFILFLNQDCFLKRDFISNVLSIFEDQKEVSAVQGKLMRMKEIQGGFEKTEFIDATGLVMLKNRRVIARGQGKKDLGQYTACEEIFGVDGAAALYRRKALDDLRIKGEFFDSDFGSYKEDVDLAWRARLFGWRAIYCPEAIAWHARTSGESAERKYFSIVRERRKIGRFSKYVSFRNQRLMQIKNELWPIFLRDFFRIILKEFVTWIYLLIFETRNLGAIFEIFKLAPRALRKRKIVMQKRRVGWREMRRWFE